MRLFKWNPFSFRMASALRDLYPEIEPFQSGHLKVSDIHQIYYEQSGNKDGKPVIYV